MYFRMSGAVPDFAMFREPLPVSLYTSFARAKYITVPDSVRDVAGLAVHFFAKLGRSLHR